jgi:peptidoglycan/xylan/chitin deacetylase (PgdA/CDA1 family)
MYTVKTPKILSLLTKNNLVWEMPGKEKRIFLTFDDGPIPELTPWILETLNNYNAKATFFCVGENLKKHQDIYHQIKENGHVIGNHTENHLNGWKNKPQEFLEYILVC